MVDQGVVILAGLAGAAAFMIGVWILNPLDGKRRSAVKSQGEIIKTALEFDLSQAADRYKRTSGLSDAEVRLHEREFRRYFALVSMAEKGEVLGMDSKEVDAFWHELLCCTSLYRAYCMAVAGRFVDHDPTGGGASRYARTWQAYGSTFGIAPDARVWPMPKLPAPPKARQVKRPPRRSSSGSAGSDDGGVSWLPGITGTGSPQNHHGYHHVTSDHGVTASHQGGDGHVAHSCGGGHSCGGHSCGGH